MRVYLAAAWSRRVEILEVANRLEAKGVEITSRWLTEEEGMNTGAREPFLRERCYIDLHDVDECDILIRFTDPETQGNEKYRAVLGSIPITADVKLLSCARMVEFGYAMAKGKSLIVVGGKQNVFDRKDGIVHLKDADELVKYLGGE